MEGDATLPRIYRWQLRLFARYAAFYLRRHFHGLHLCRDTSLTQFAGMPLLICLNHPAWWDPLLALYLSQRFFSDRTQYAPIAAAGLEKYRIFERFGFFGIDSQTAAGLRRFLSVGRSVLTLPDGVLWVTAQGHFTDVRVRPVTLASGVGHLARSAERPFVLLPLALEYAFWDERTPEAFAAFGEPMTVSDGYAHSPAEWAQRFAERLETTQAALSVRVMERDHRHFEPLLRGRTGVGGVYDLWRRAKALAHRQRFRPDHSGPAS